MKTLLVAGARPNFMKVAPILDCLEASGHPAVLVHTGQHYDDRMSRAFFQDLGIRDADYNLGVGAGSHADQTARVMQAFEPVLHAERPDWVVVVGDVNSTLACTLVAAKLREELGCRIAHVEAGLRSGDWNMPEEINRILTDRVADLLLTPSEDALPNLTAEGVPEDRMEFVGNVMIDTLVSQLDGARSLDMPGRLGMKGVPLAVATLHRPSNVDDPAALDTVLQALATVAEGMRVVLPMHPRTRARIDGFGLGDLCARLTILEPLGYREMLSLLDAAAVVLTDSGGVQEETTWLGVPCVTLREQTERPVTVTQGTNRMAPWPLTAAGVMEATRSAVARGRVPAGTAAPVGWDGRASERIVAALLRRAPRDALATG